MHVESPMLFPLHDASACREFVKQRIDGYGGLPPLLIPRLHDFASFGTFSDLTADGDLRTSSKTSKVEYRTKNSLIRSIDDDLEPLGAYLSNLLAGTRAVCLAQDPLSRRSDAALRSVDCSLRFSNDLVFFLPFFVDLDVERATTCLRRAHITFPGAIAVVAELDDSTERALRTFDELAPEVLTNLASAAFVIIVPAADGETFLVGEKSR